MKLKIKYETILLIMHLNPLTLAVKYLFDKVIYKFCILYHQIIRILRCVVFGTILELMCQL